MKFVADLEPGEYVRGYVNKCEICEALYIGRVNRKTCSERCRQERHRRKTDDT